MEIDKLLGDERESTLRLLSEQGAYNMRVVGSVPSDKAGAEGEVDVVLDIDDDRSLLDPDALAKDLQNLLGRPVRLTEPLSSDPYLKLRIGTRTTKHITLSDQGGVAHVCAISADGRTIVSLSDDGFVKVWDARSGVARQTLGARSYGGTSARSAATA